MTKSLHAVQQRLVGANLLGFAVIEQDTTTVVADTSVDKTTQSKSGMVKPPAQAGMTKPITNRPITAKLGMTKVGAVKPPPL
ncbi:hypothetical protein [Acidisoma cladoniae]|jgi:hypothetical protein|uniref:hypothetical protein n=1 Tax=Acidisoma cladoniae TaxID=3040935 RepID=UPI00254A7E70|nr:hypothetical protein [Acidisoma sp. PAMC 29798]